MKRIFTLYVLLVLCNSCASQTQISKSVSGNWEVYKYKIGPIAAMTTEDASILKGKKIQITSNQVTEFGIIFKNCVFDQSKIDIEEYFDSFKLDYNLIDLKFKGKQTLLYSCKCYDIDQEETYFEFVENGNELLYSKEGFFFHLKK